MQALPLFLDRLADPITAVVVSVTVVLIFGEPTFTLARDAVALGRMLTCEVPVITEIACSCDAWCVVLNENCTGNIRA